MDLKLDALRIECAELEGENHLLRVKLAAALLQVEEVRLGLTLRDAEIERLTGFLASLRERRGRAA